MSTIVHISPKCRDKAGAHSLLEPMAELEQKVAKRGIGSRPQIGKSGLYLVALGESFSVIVYRERINPDSIVIFADIVEHDTPEGKMLIGDLVTRSPRWVRSDFLALEPGVLASLREQVRRIGQAEDVGTERMDHEVQRLKMTLRTILGAQSLIQPRHVQQLDTAMVMLQAIRGFQEVPPSWFVEITPDWNVETGRLAGRLTRFRIDKYRRHENVDLLDLGRVNLIVGVNNTGKTSVLEALYLLAHQADPNGSFEVVRQRTRLEGAPDAAWFVDQIPGDIRLSGEFSGLRTSVSAHKERVARSDTMAIEYLSTLIIQSTLGDRVQASRTDFFAGGWRRHELPQDPRWLCRATLNSPFSLADRNVLERANRASIEEKSKGAVIQFLKEHLDGGLQGIELADRFARFLVTHDAFPEAVDLSVFGQGLQRIFQIALLFAANRRGIVLIDEFENAIHADLLLTYTRFIQELAVRHDVQVFLTTHSKEAIDAFVQNEFRNEDVVAFTLHAAPGGAVRRFAGPQLARAIDSIDLDIRRV